MIKCSEVGKMGRMGVQINISSFVYKLSVIDRNLRAPRDNLSIETAEMKYCGLDHAEPIVA